MSRENSSYQHFLTLRLSGGGGLRGGLVGDSPGLSKNMSDPYFIYPIAA